MCVCAFRGCSIFILLLLIIINNVMNCANSGVRNNVAFLHVDQSARLRVGPGYDVAT